MPNVTTTDKNRDSALEKEIAFWERIVDGTHRFPERSERFRQRIAGKLSFPRYLLKYLAADRTNRILDVGSGPASLFGPPTPPLKAEVVAIDPLADPYNEMLRRHGLTPFYPVVAGSAETLSEHVEAASFDIVFCKNALDHVTDPRQSLIEMEKVCRPGGAIVLLGRVNEGVHQNYHQLHKWNILPCEDDLIVWNPENAFSVRKLLGRASRMTAKVNKTSTLKSDVDYMYHAEILLS